MPFYTDSVPARLRALRAAAGMSREQLAQRALTLRAPGNNIGRIERGVSRPTDATFKKIAYALGVTPKFLSEGYASYVGNHGDGWTVDEAFPARLARLMREAKLDAREVAIKMGLHGVGHFVRWMSGSLAPRPDTLTRIAIALNVNAEFLATGIQQSSTSQTLDELPQGKRIELVRRAAKLDRQAFGEACGIEPTPAGPVFKRIGLWEKGRCKASYPELLRISSAMGVSLTWLATGAPPASATHEGDSTAPETHPAMAIWHEESALSRASQELLQSLRHGMAYGAITGPDVNFVKHALNARLLERFNQSTGGTGGTGSTALQA